MTARLFFLRAAISFQASLTASLNSPQGREIALPTGTTVRCKSFRQVAERASTLAAAISRNEQPSSRYHVASLPHADDN
jgi:hypothetical protein